MKVDALCMQLSAVTMAWVAFVFTLIANFYCTFTVQEISVDVTSTDANSTNTTTTSNVPIGPYYAGIWNYRTYKTFWSQVDGTTYVSTYATCAKYPEGTEVDAKWKTAQAFTIIATVLGGIAAIAMISTTCDAPTGYWKSYTGLLLLVCISQGLALIFLSSNACASQGFEVGAEPEAGSVGATLPIYAEGKLSTCSISSGGSLAATALCVWFLAAVFSAMGASGDEKEDTHEAAQDVEALESKGVDSDKLKEEADVEGPPEPEVAEQAPPDVAVS